MGMFSGRMAHSSGVEGVTPIHWRGKAVMFGNAKRFNEANAARLLRLHPPSCLTASTQGAETAKLETLREEQRVPLSGFQWLGAVR